MPLRFCASLSIIFLYLPIPRPNRIPYQNNQTCRSLPSIHLKTISCKAKRSKRFPTCLVSSMVSLLFVNIPSSSHVSALSQSRWYHFSLFRLAFCTILTFAKKTAVRRFRTTVFSSSAPPIQHPPQHGIYIDFLHIFRRNHFCSTDFCPIPQINQLPNFRSRLYWRFYR